MKTIIITLPTSGNKVPVELERKKMKTCRLKVYPEQTVRLSIPVRVSTKWAEAFLREKSGWIEAKLEFFQKTAGAAAKRELGNGSSIKLLGEDMTLVVTECEKGSVYQEEKQIHICARAADNQERVKAIFETWWRGQAKAILEDRVDEWYPVIEKYGIERPRVAVRKMRTLWGSCSVHRNVVTFNLSLIQACIPCVDYVVLHELAHFLYPNHSKGFYDFLSGHMPDWKERKSRLNQEVVPGL
ncbi:MAG: M48 family metallopeptidase [Oscillospiraceae bacterium]|nr:M48 family metallopeptidase [Oscillospiraceae bacterium]MDE7170813.1 M48 family metallopeptidase [Oscillospiraceae bacterium]